MLKNNVNGLKWRATAFNITLASNDLNTFEANSYFRLLLILEIGTNKAVRIVIRKFTPDLF